ncbi:hypothetical protein XH98_36375 [Bradyrhizobium sp. CCBAU 51745]|uniref:hypothetical protein n=1 Tax=Bradyrhizobium sp. CCBAU 51745 TaxID=1325099 RepID=UPI002306B65F|nr:hypothetical protein [Bradyrhizobium sp. CCBAU 51745]MDA9444462.1 hypothetical protein [Bradyrhizobium sp. CCBAU 51745]
MQILLPGRAWSASLFKAANVGIIARKEVGGGRVNRGWPAVRDQLLGLSGAREPLWTEHVRALAELYAYTLEILHCDCFGGIAGHLADADQRQCTVIEHRQMGK